MNFLALWDAGQWIKWDPQVSIEGIATATGVLGAAVGYVLSLISDASKSKKEARNRGTQMTILDLLRHELWTGLKIDEIRTRYGERYAGDRKRYALWPPSKLEGGECERFLIRMQLDFLIDLAGPDHYRIRVKQVSHYEMEESNRARVSTIVHNAVTSEKLRSVVDGWLSSDTKTYSRTDGLRALIRLGDEEAVKRVVRALDSSDPELALQAASILAEYCTEV